jgi:prolyl oligopeptidase
MVERKLLWSAAVLAAVGLTGPLAAQADGIAQDPAMALASEAEPMMTYPETRTVDLVDEKFGISVPDPYRWLENDVRVDGEVADWVKAQNAVTQNYMATLSVTRDAFREAMTGLFAYDRLEVPVAAGERLFYQRKSAGQNQAVLYVRETDEQERVLIDPALWSADGATALAEWSPSDDGKLLLYAIQDGGSDWRTLRVIDVKTGIVLPDTIEWAKFTELQWMPRNKGFLYSRFPAPQEGAAFQSLNQNQAVYLHVMGRPQDKDILVHATPDRPELNHVAEATSDQQWVVITSSSGTDERYGLSVVKVDTPKLEVRPIVTDFAHDWRLIDGIGDTLYFITNKDAPLGRVVKIDLSQEKPEWQEVIAENGTPINDAVMVGDVLAVSYLESVQAKLSIYTLDGVNLGPVKLPGIGQIDDLKGSAKSGTGYLAFESYNRPRTIYKFGASSIMAAWASPKLPFSPETISVTQTFYPSNDGTEIPMFLVRKTSLAEDSGHPTILYGYGGFNQAQLPTYKEQWMAWVQAGGILAVANLRGGSEYGKPWHDAGRLMNKQNVFDDFIAAGEFLKRQGIAAANGLAIEGRSNGGLLIGAAMNQRPDLFEAGHAAVGVMDMLRFDQFTAGRYWVDDYGYPDKEADFKNLLSYSPYHNIARDTEYPALIVSTADTDDRVVPGHSFKYIAALQAANTGPKPHLIRIESRAGHGSGKPTDKTIAEYSDIYAFLAHWTGLAAK